MKTILGTTKFELAADRDARAPFTELRPSRRYATNFGVGVAMLAGYKFVVIGGTVYFVVDAAYGWDNVYRDIGTAVQDINRQRHILKSQVPTERSIIRWFTGY